MLKPQLDPFLTDWIENHLWNGVRANLQRDGELASVAFLRISAELRLPPALRISNGEKDFTILVGSLSTHLMATVLLYPSDKLTSTALVQALAKDWKADTVVFLAEAWRAEKSEAQIRQDPEKAFLIPPQLDPQKQEIVMISVQTKKGFWISQNPITRNDKEPQIASKPEPLTYLPQVAGNFVVNLC